jgi:uncharacterized protein YsxB (DUF464 family)
VNDEIRNKEKILEIEQRAKNWWKWFWGTIVFLLISYLALVYLSNYQDSQNYNVNTTKGRENYSAKMRDVIIAIKPEWAKYISNLSEQSKENIKEKIHKEVSAAYEPVYNEGIKNFSEFHYSVAGEYIELYNASADGARSYLKMEKKDNFDTLVYEMLFKSTDFDEHLKGAFTNVNNFALEEIAKNMTQLQKRIQTDLNTTSTETTYIVNELLNISEKDMKSRFKNEVSAGFRAGGVSSGAIVGAVASKQIAKMFTKKVATKVAIKATTKAAGAAAGATTGGVEGLVCGPGAPVCSTVGAIIGGVVGWFATDAAIVAYDEHYNGNKFKEELNFTIEQQQIKTEQQLYEVYTKSFDTINEENTQRLESFKHTQNKEHL